MLVQLYFLPTFAFAEPILGRTNALPVGRVTLLQVCPVQTSDALELVV